MGIVSGYTAHFYCDCCRDFMEVDGIGIETLRDAVRDAKTAWLLRKDGIVLCSKCMLLPSPTILNEDDREGIEWNFKLLRGKEKEQLCQKK